MLSERQYEQFFVLLDAIVNAPANTRAKLLELQKHAGERDAGNLEEFAAWFE
jgi:hypothetical protein